MTRWARLVDNRQYFRKSGLALFAFALVVAFTGVKVPAAAVFGLLAMQCFMAQSFTEQLVIAQERIDMKRIARGEDPEQ